MPDFSREPSAVIGIVFSQDRKKVLVLKRRDVPVWVFPGGGVDEGESPEGAVLREVLEETGLKAEIARKVGEYTPINKLTYLTHLYECKPIGGEIGTGTETREIGYFPVNELPENFFPVHLTWLADALANSSEVIHRPISQVTYFRVFLYFCRHPIHVIRILLSRLGLPLNTK